MKIGLFVAAMIGAFVLVGWGILWSYRAFNRHAEAALWRTYDGLDANLTPRKGDVRLRFHTYHGLLLWFVQTEHDGFLTPDRARELLGRLNRYNCSWGILSRGLVIVPALSFGNYLVQSRTIRAQVRAFDGDDLGTGVSRDAETGESFWYDSGR